MSSQPLRYELRDHTAVVTMDDGKANALSYAMLDALSEAISRAEGEAKALVLAGRPGKFCAGFDLKVMMSGPEGAKGLLQRGGEVLMQLYGSKLPTVAACTGHALAGGALVLLCCDTRIGAEGSFKLGLNEVQIGLPVPVLAYELARDRLSKQGFYTATLQATIYDPKGAAGVGFLDRTAPGEEVLAAALAEAKRLAGLSARAYAFTKSCLRQPIIDRVHAHSEANLVAITKVMAAAMAG